MAEAGVNPLVSTQKPSDQLQVVLHPLVLLNISDYVTRHTLRQQTGPVVGALLGQQNTREITVEHAFDCQLETLENGDIVLSLAWFHKRLEQMKTVHRDRELDFVGLWALLPETGPDPKILPLYAQASEITESSVLLAFHPEQIAEPSVGGKLPLTIYEYTDEASEQSSAPAQPQAGNEDSEMTDGDDATATKATGLTKKFRELPYTVDMAEAEMISVDFVAKGGANASASADTGTEDKAKKSVTAKESKASSSKGKAAVLPATKKPTTEDVMSREDEELVATLTAKSNAIKMLQSRIQLIIKYLESLPPAYLSSDPTAPAAAAADAPNGTYTTPSPTILRSIQALVHRLPLLAPPSQVEDLRQELLRESNDVNLISLMNDVVQSLGEVRDLGRKFAIVEQARNQRLKGGQNDGAFASRDMDDILSLGRSKMSWLPS